MIKQNKPMVNQGILRCPELVEGFAFSSTPPSSAGCDESVSWTGEIGGSLAFIPTLTLDRVECGASAVSAKFHHLFPEEVGRGGMKKVMSFFAVKMN
jgi:hypothetical protein